MEEKKKLYKWDGSVWTELPEGTTCVGARELTEKQLYYIKKRQEYHRNHPYWSKGGRVIALFSCQLDIERNWVAPEVPIGRSS